MSRKEYTVADLIHETTSLADVLGRSDGIKVVFKGDGYATDGKTIFYPALDMNQKLTHDFLSGVRGGTDHETGHLAHSDMELIMPTYKKWHSSGRGVLKNIHNNLEDVWMEDKVMARYPGSYKNLFHIEEKIKREGYEYFVKTEYDMTSIDAITVPGCIKTNTPAFNLEGTWHRKLWDELNPTLKAHCDVWIKHCMAAKNSGELITLAKAIYKQMIDDPEFNSNPEDFDPQSGHDFKDNGPMSEEEKEAVGQGDEAMQQVMQGSDLSKDVKEVVVGGMKDMREFNRDSYIPYDTSKDVVYKRTGKRDPNGNDHIYDAILSTDHTQYDRIRKGIAGNISTMKNKLRRSLIAKQRKGWVRHKESGILDANNLAKGYIGSPRIRKTRTDKSDLNTAVTILIDLSGSMCGGKAKVARDSTIALCECLEGTSINYKVVGFENARETEYGVGEQWGRIEPLDTVVFKDFNEPLRRAKGSISQLHDICLGNNTDYDFVCNELNTLNDRREDRKVLVVLSDGYPSHEAGGHEDGKFVKEVLRKYKKKHGIESVGIGINSGSVSDIYDDHVVVKNINELSSTVFNKLTNILVKGGK